VGKGFEANLKNAKNKNYFSGFASLVFCLRGCGGVPSILRKTSSGLGSLPLRLRGFSGIGKPSTNYLDKKSPPWKGNFYQLISLWEIMETLKAYAHDIANFRSVLVSYMEKFDYMKDIPISTIDKEMVEGWLKSILSQAKELGLDLSVKQIHRAQWPLKHDSTPNVVIALDKVRETMLDELENVMFLHIKPINVENYKNYRKGWEEVIERFNAIIDIEEAYKCFALNRYAAAVFHSTQIIETGLIELGKFIGVSDPKSGWTAVTNRLDKIVNKTNYKDLSSFEQANFSFLEQLYGTVEGLKNAWRNKIGHVQGRLILMSTEFTPEITEEILFASRAFMRRLTEGLPKS
jgi:hypothetical protein